MRTSAVVVAASAFFAASTFAAPAPAPLQWVDHDGLRPYGSRRPQSDRPTGTWSGPGATPTCMSDADANITADNFRQLIQGYTIEMATEALTEDFIDYSSAVSIIINKGASEPKDVTVPIFTNRTQFMEGHGKQKPIPFETLNVWHNCNGTVSMRWMSTRSGFGQPNEQAAIPVIGTAILETHPAEANNTYNYRIHTLYSEFNTAAWLVNNGVYTPEGPITPVPVTKRSVEDAKNIITSWVQARKI